MDSLSAAGRIAFERDPDKDMFVAIIELLQTTFAEVSTPTGRPYNATRAYVSLYRNGARGSVSKAVLNPQAQGFGYLGDAGRLDLSYEWFALNPTWSFSLEVRRRAWEKLNAWLGSK